MKFTRLVCLLCLGASLVGCQQVARDYQLNYRYHDHARVIILDVENIPNQYIKDEMIKLGQDGARDGYNQTIVETENGINDYIMIFGEDGQLIFYHKN